MGFKSILDRTERRHEKISLMQFVHDSYNELGLSEEKLVFKQKLNGIIQQPTVTDIAVKGTEGEVEFYGFFMPFQIPLEDLNNYRIKYEKPYETYILKFKRYDPNLFLGKNQNHIEAELILEKKI